MLERRTRTPAAGFLASSAPWGRLVSDGSSNATQWTNGRPVGASGSSMTNSSCAKPSGTGDQARAGDRSLPPTRFPVWTRGIVASFSKSGLFSASESAPARLGEFQARPACPARRFFSNLPSSAIGPVLVGGGRMVRAAGSPRTRAEARRSGRLFDQDRPPCPGPPFRQVNCAVKLYYSGRGTGRGREARPGGDTGMAQDAEV